jgi:hypothetical protein
MSWVDVTTAVSTASAAIVALGLGVRGIYVDRARRRDEEVRQARLVMVSEAAIGPGPEGYWLIYITVYNYSEAPIHDVTVGIDIWQGEEAQASPDDHDGVNWQFVAPREEKEITFKFPREGGIALGSPELNFLDSSGRRFEKNSSRAEPKRIVHEPQLVVQIVDGEPVVTVQQHKSRFKVITEKVIPWMQSRR